MIFERKHGVGTVIETALIDTADDKAIATGLTFADGDMKVSSDQQALTNGAAEYAAFTSGSEEPQPGDTINNNSQTAVVCGCFLTSGSWSGGDAAGFIFLEQVSGALASGQVDIDGGTSDVMTLSGDTTVRAIVASGYRVLVGLTSTELTCRELTCQIKDQGSDTWLDDGFKVKTDFEKQRVDVAEWKGTEPADLTDTDKVQVSLQHNNASVGNWNVGKTGYALTADTGLGNQNGTVGGIAGTINTLDQLDTAQDTQHSTTQSQITAMRVNTRANLSVPIEIETPDASTQVYKIRLFLFDVDGNMEAPDSTPTIALVNAAGTDRSSRLSAASNPSTGVYSWDYTATAGDAEEQLNWTFTVVEGGLTRTYPATSYVVEETAYRFSSSDRAALLDIPNTAEFEARTLPSAQYGTANPGDEMDLVDAPNATAIEAINAGVGFTGVT